LTKEKLRHRSREGNQKSQKRMGFKPFKRGEEGEKSGRRDYQKKRNGARNVQDSKYILWVQKKQNCVGTRSGGHHLKE